jgi:MarR family transcriptional regulator, 2-MHQ and catechol-resistance regulon repressor
MKTAPNCLTPTIAEKVLHALLRTWGLLRQAQDPYFARFGISASQWGILRVLQRAELKGESKLPLKIVSERLLIQPPSVTGVVDRLERQGLVERSASVNDLRVRHLGLTQDGRNLITRVLDGHTERIQQLLGALEPDEQQTMLQLLKRLEGHLEAQVLTSPEFELAGGRIKKR